MSFQSSREIEKKRQDLKETRQVHLQKAKEDYERNERKKAAAKARGEDTWMLDSVNLRLDNEQQSLKKSKKKKKEKKKKKKRKKNESSDSSSDSDDESSKKKKRSKKKKKKKESSSSSSESDEGPQWVEKSSSDRQTVTDGAGASAVKGPKLERESWMSAPPDLFPTVSRQDLINRKNKEKEELDRQRELLNKPGTHAKELNPYWKDGGTGLPEAQSGKRAAVSVPACGDGGLSWLKKSYERCVQQAKEEGRSLEELAAERWGSLKVIQKQIRDAEKAQYGGSSRRDDKSSDFNKDRNSNRGRGRFMKPTDDGDSDDYRRSDSKNSRPRSRTPERSRSRRSRSRSQGRRSRSRSGERYRKRSHSRDRDNYRQRSRERSSRYDRRSRSPDRYKSGSNFGASSLKGRFMKPGEISESSDSQRSRSRQGDSDRTPAWRKKEFQKPKEDEGQERKQVQRKSEESSRDSRDKRRRRRSSSESSSSSSSDSSSESSEEEVSKQERSSPRQPEVRILSEKEMNDLGAKIVKAEIMGNEAQAAKLKAQLEAAREAKKNAPAEVRGQGHGGKVRNEDDDLEVTLTRTDRSGMARPVPEASGPIESGGKRRRKKQKAETHTGKQGERTKYFDDDDKFDLKTLVEREKLGTAEDQNQMFARLAGRAAQRTDDDFQVDDVFLSKAHERQSQTIQDQRDRAAAIHEHKKMATAMEKCNFCFGNVSKHLIIAIGTKVYLALPHNKSLTEGHCLIVPMQHTTSSTAVDEDVWSEIVLFRKTLTKMFMDRDEDVVFMETSMRLRQFPHMCIECVPMEKEVGDMAPIYFKKAIQDSESEWSQNKKVIELANRDIRRAVPKGFPYFAVDFGNEGGFAHVIEDEQKFPYYFGKEIIGGMIDADHRLWKKPPKESFEDQRKKVLKFAETWKQYDWTQNLSKNVEVDNSSSSSDSD